MRQDSIRSGYVSDHEALTASQRAAAVAAVQQVSIDSVPSQDSRLCYLTSSEVSLNSGDIWREAWGKFPPSAPRSFLPALGPIKEKAPYSGGTSEGRK